MLKHPATITKAAYAAYLVVSKSIDFTTKMSMRCAAHWCMKMAAALSNLQSTCTCPVLTQRRKDAKAICNLQLA